MARSNWIRRLQRLSMFLPYLVRYLASWLGETLSMLTRVRFIWAGLVLVLFSATNLNARPELFPDAIPYGAKDCSFCHQSVAGGTAVNERGAWLLSERTSRNVDAIDIDWLKDRGESPDHSRTLTITNEFAAQTAQPVDTEATTADIQRPPLDYTTSWGEWPSYNGGLKSQKYSPLPHINKASIHSLALAWVWEGTVDKGGGSVGTWRRRGGGASQTFNATPLMVDGKVFVRTRFSTVAAIDAATGVELWEYDPGIKDGMRPAMFGWTTRGLAYHKQASCDDQTPCERVILLTGIGWMNALDPTTGEIIKSFGEEGSVDLTKGMRRPLVRSQVSFNHPPLVCNDVIVVGSQTSDMSQFQNRTGKWNENLPVGDVRGFDPVTGKQKWVFKTIPQEGEFGVETWENESWRWMGNTNVWSTFSCDAELGHVYLPVTAPTDHMYGGNRLGDNLFGTSVVALNVATGERVWHYQITHHDIWDYDLPAPPVVADLVVNGEPRKVVSQPTKVGFLFVLDRLTGEPVWPVEERPVPASKLKGEVASPTQPHPTKPPPFELQGVTLDDLNNITPEIYEQAKAFVEKLDYGPLYTPISERGTVFSPGIGGGANWTGASFDPIDRRLYVSSRRDPTVANSVPFAGRFEGLSYRENWSFPRIEGFPLLKPPWSSITAYDLDKGEIFWQVPNGDTPRAHERMKDVAEKLPPLGRMGTVAGILVLPELLIMGHPGQPSRLKALDKVTGAEIWSTELSGYFESPTPITYRIGDYQYIAIATGSPFEPARISAFRLTTKSAVEE